MSIRICGQDGQNFATKGFIGTWIHVCLPSFVEIGKAEVTKQVRGIHHEKKLVIFCPFYVASGAISSKILLDHSFPIPHPFAKFCPNPSSVRGDISGNVSQIHYDIGVKPVGISPTFSLLLRRN